MPRTGEPDSAPPLTKTESPKHILVVEDDDDIRRLNTEVLVQFGYRVDAAEDGAAGWEALQLESYDLLVTDNNMPKVSGVELLMKLRAAGMALPVIMATATLPKKDLTQFPWLQPTAMLLKPYTIGELMESVEKVLHKLSPTPFADFMLYPEKLETALKTAEISQTKKPAGALPRYPTNSPQRILVVDDNCDTRQLSIDALIGSGYDAEGVTDGVAGWEALQTYDYDLVVTDNKMPRMTGVEMIGKVRSANITVPVIMATKNLPMDEFARRPWLKPDAMLQRPFTDDDLLATVKNVLSPDDSKHWL